LRIITLHRRTIKVVFLTGLHRIHPPHPLPPFSGKTKKQNMLGVICREQKAKTCKYFLTSLESTSFKDCPKRANKLCKLCSFLRASASGH
jgi:hypothetical protein